MVKRREAWSAFLICGFVASIAAIASGSLIVMGAVSLVMGVTAASVGLRIARRDTDAGQAWLLFTVAAVLFVAGSVTRVVHGLIVGVAAPFPSPADAVTLTGHLCLLAGGILLGHLRSPERDRAAIIDGAIMAVGLQTPVWAFILWPYLTDAAIPLEQRLLNATYSVMTTLLLAAIGRLAIGPGARTTSYKLLAAAVMAIFLQDVLTTINTVQDLPVRLDRMLAAPCFVLFGAAALHPTRLRIAEATQEIDRRLSHKRIAAIGLSVLVVPIVVSLQLGFHQPPTLAVEAASMALMLLLVLVRVTSIARSQERATALRTIQRDANGELAMASTRRGMHHAALRAATRLLDDPSARIVLCELDDDDRLTVVEAIGRDSGMSIGSSRPVDDLPVALAAGMRDGRLATTEGSFDLAHPDADRDGRRVDLPADGAVTLVPLVTHGQVAGAIVATTPEPLDAARRESVEMLGATLSLSLESADLTEDLLRRRSERRYQALIEHSSDIVLIVTDDLEISYASPATLRLLGRDHSELVGTHVARWVNPDDWAGLARRLDEQTTHDDGIEVRVRHQDGDHRWFEVRTRDLRHDLELAGIIVTAREISDRKATELELASQEARYRALVQYSSDVVAIIDGDGRWAYLSPAVSDVVGFAPQELLGQPAVAVIAPEARERFRTEYPQLNAHRIGARLAVNRFETTVLHRNGELRHVNATVTDLRHEPSVAGLVLNVRDDTERNRLERNLRYQSLHDSLTGLPNRTLFTQQIDQGLAAIADSSAEVGVLVIDLDDFKTVNDSLGHAAGDELLELVARRLFRRLGTSDLAARLGGDEFGVLVLDDGGRSPAELAERVLAMFDDPFVIRDRDIAISASIGWAVSRGDQTAEVLLRSADTAMYRAKDRGKGRAERFEDELHADAFARFELKGDLTRALEHNQFICHYQPIVSLETGRITGTEALVRWQHPDRGLIPPNLFIPLAEETGQIVTLGRIVLEEACRQLRQWQLLLAADATLSMSVNVSVRQLAHAALVREVRSAIAESGIDPSTLTLEITETTLMQDTDDNLRRLHELRDLGVSLAVDDFGTGYSSLGYVQRFPVDIIKLDRSFVSGLGSSPGEGAVVLSMIELAQRLGVHTVAEGIDRPEQVPVLRRLGADLGQGYLFSPPATASTITALLTELDAHVALPPG